MTAMKSTCLYAFLTIAIALTLAGCKDDPLPVTVIGFSSESQEVVESDGTLASIHPDILETAGFEPPSPGRIITVPLTFDRALAGEVVFNLAVAGTARRTGTADELNDYAILTQGENLTVNGDKVTIEAGAESAAIRIRILEDFLFEYVDGSGDLTDDGIPFETIVLTLSPASGPGQLNGSQHTVYILEDDIVATLFWDAVDFPDDTEEAESQVNMDMILWFEEVVWLAGTRDDRYFEAFLVPAGLGEGSVYISYTYVDGESDDLYFEAAFFNTAGTLEGQDMGLFDDVEGLIFDGHYTLANRYAWSLPDSPPQFAQSVVKEGINYKDFSTLQEFSGGSRHRRLVPAKLDRSVLSQVAKNGGKWMARPRK